MFLTYFHSDKERKSCFSFIYLSLIRTFVVDLTHKFSWNQKLKIIV